MSNYSVFSLAYVPMSANPTEQSLSARKRPAQLRAVATVEAILEAAARILEQDGFGGYNTNDIARIAGVSVGSLYQYFPNKDAITTALIMRETGALHDALRQVGECDPGWRRVERLIAVAVDHQLDRSALSRLLDLEEERLPLATELADRRASMTAMVRCYLVDLPSAAARADCAAQDTIAIIKGMVDAAGARGEDDRSALIFRIRRAVLGYLCWNDQDESRL